MDNSNRERCMAMADGFQETKMNILVSSLSTTKKVGEYTNGIMDQSLKVTSLKGIELFNLQDKE